MSPHSPVAVLNNDNPQLIAQTITSHETRHPADELQDKPKTDSSDKISFSQLQADKLEPYLPPVAHDSRPSWTAPRHHHHHHHHQQQQQQQEEVHDVPSPHKANCRHSAVSPNNKRPFVTLTYAQSLDSQVSTAPGVRTTLSGPDSKAMTHFLRSRHAAILVGVGTAAADDPGLNCRLEGEPHQPRPVVLDPGARWEVTALSKVAQLAAEGKGKGPWVLYAAGAEGVVPDPERVRAVEDVGGRYVGVPSLAGTEGKGRRNLQWDSVLSVLREEGIESVMVEGGGKVINDLLALSNRGVDVVDSVIITIAPTWLGYGGVGVAPERPVDEQGRGTPGPRLGEVSWTAMGEDIVLCGRVRR